MSSVRRACRWTLYHSGRWYCKLPAIRSPGKEPLKSLADGCPKDCGEMDIVSWKKDLYGEEYDDDEDGVTLDAMPMPVKVEET